MNTSTDEPEIETQSPATSSPAVCQPNLRLDFYDSDIIMSRYTGAGIMTYAVAATDLVAACSLLPISSGLLPPNTLFLRRTGESVKLGIFVPAQKWKVISGPLSLTIPLPPFIFVGAGQSYAVFAVKQRPVNLNEPLYHMPCANVFGSGQICPGNTQFPVCEPATIYQALAEFLQNSRFNTHLANGRSVSFPADVNELWLTLNGKRKFPLKDLVPMRQRVERII
jgi:hypothetical protein